MNRTLYKNIRAANEKLKSENKALEQSLEKQVRVNTLLITTIKRRRAKDLRVEQSRDELLEAISQSEIVFRNTGDPEKAKMLIPVIRRAQALKEKE